jgi:hypothetical protein
MKREANSAVEVADGLEAAADSEEWVEREPAITRTVKEEKFLQRILDQPYKGDDKKRIRIEKRVATARNKMAVAQEQPSIMSKLRVVNRYREIVDCPVNLARVSWNSDFFFIYPIYDTQGTL